MASDAALRRIFQETQTLAMVGASNNPDRDSYAVMKFLLDWGYRVYPIHPALVGGHVHGVPAYAALKDLPIPVDMVDVFRASEALGGIVDELLELPWRPKTLWTQLGVVNEAAAADARAAGVEVVMDRCLKIELLRLKADRPLGSR